MNSIVIIKAKTDLGVHVDGTDKGPDKIYNGNSTDIIKENVVKSKSKDDLRKNEKDINSFNKTLYKSVYQALENNSFPIILGGDHSMAIGSALASNDYNKSVGIIWIDAHTDFNTFETTRTGNIHGLPLATIAGYRNEELRTFAKGSINPNNVVIVGARSIDPWEIGNVTDAKVTYFTTDDIRTMGIKNIIEKAFKLASNNTNGVHVSFDIDVIDPVEAPGVSIPEIDGITKKEAYEIIDEVLKHNNIKSFDIVEYNPDYDIDNKTNVITKKILEKLKTELS